tara:strand:+ start:90 stop:242 length:153 start_codon:yes stop_codon:yes gene_type:complete
MILGTVDICQEYWEVDTSIPPYFSPLVCSDTSIGVDYSPPSELNKKEKNG